MVVLLSGKCVLPRGRIFIFPQILAMCLSKSQCHPFLYIENESHYQYKRVGNSFCKFQLYVGTDA